MSRKQRSDLWTGFQTCQSQPWNDCHEGGTHRRSSNTLLASRSTILIHCATHLRTECSKHTQLWSLRSSKSQMSTANFAAAFQKLLPKSLPPGLSTKPANLYQVLSRYARDGIGQRVHQTRWTSKGISDCYWEVTRTSLKKGATHGKAWGHLVWRGQLCCMFH